MVIPRRLNALEEGFEMDVYEALMARPDSREETAPETQESVIKLTPEQEAKINKQLDDIRAQIRESVNIAFKGCTVTFSEPTPEEIAELKAKGQYTSLAEAREKTWTELIQRAIKSGEIWRPRR